MGPRRPARWGFRLLAAAGIPLLLLATTELGLRLAGIGYPASFFLEQTIRGKRCLVDNPRFGWRFFPPEAARTPRNVVIPAEKPADTIRIVILGESAALGDPEPDFGFARMLEVLLRDRYPTRRFEIVNAAMTAINSHAVLPIARDCRRLQADFWVVYMGNNEVVGPFGAGTVLGTQTPPLAYIRANLALKSKRIGQMLDEVLRRVSQRGAKVNSWGGMEMFVDNQVAEHDPRMARVYAHFAANLEDILAAGRQSGAQLIVSTIASNLKDCAPFGSMHRPGLSPEQLAAWEQAFRRGTDQLKAGRPHEAITAFQEAGAIDDQSADLSFVWGQALLAGGKTNDARTRFERARDADTLRFRADHRINELIRQAAAHTSDGKIELLDAEQELAGRSEGAIPGANLLYEHVHFNFNGNYQLAMLVAERIDRSLVRAALGTGGKSWATQEECARQLAWTAFNEREVWETLQRRLELPPFTRQINHESQLQQVITELAKLDARLNNDLLQRAAQAYKQAIQQAPEDWTLQLNLGKLLSRGGDVETAMSAFRKVIDWVPQHKEAYYLLGNLLDKTGRSAEAEAAFRKAIQLQPHFPEAYNGLGLALASQERYPEALKAYETALRQKTDLATAHVNLGLALSRIGRIPEAKGHYQQALQLKPNSPGAYVNLGKLLNQEGQLTAAASNYLAALKLDPSNALIHFNLGNVLVKMGQNQDGISYYRAAVRLEPGLAEAHCNLGFELARQGQEAEAMTQFAEAIRIKPDYAEAHLNLGVAYANQRRMNEAVHHFQEALRIDPQYATARKYLEAAQRRQTKNPN
jgi:tetratricopeptide (TPR) repeat protein